MTTYYARTEQTYSGGEQLFSITFPYINKNHIEVFVNDEPIVNFEFNTDSQIQINDTLENGDKISIRRNTPIDSKLVVFSDTSILDKDVQNLDSTQVFNAIQEIYDNNVLFRTEVLDDLITTAQATTERVDAFEETINADIAEIEANMATLQGLTEQTTEQLERAEQLAERVEFGMKWTSFTAANWVVAEDGIHYELLLNDLALVNSIYSGTWDNKELVCGVDVVVTDSGCKLISLNSFDGFVLSAASTMGNYLHTQDIASDIWVINHNLGHIPVVILLNSDDIQMFGTIEHTSINQCRVTFTQEVSGRAYLR